MKTKLSVLGLVLVCAGSAFGMWFNGTFSSDWGTTGNWNPAHVPTIADEVYGYSVSNPTIASGTNAFAAWNPIGGGVTLIINGSYTSGQRMSIGYGSGTGVVNVNTGGVLNLAGNDLYVGEGGIGVLNVSGTVNAGAVDILVANAGSGTINVLPGGSVVSTSRLTLGDRVPGSPGTAALIISVGGSFSCAANWGDLDAAVADGRIRATDGAALIVENHTTDSGKTFTAIIQTSTSDPYPAENEVITCTTPTLSWKGGTVGSYDVYFGTDINKIVNARRLAGDFNNDRTVNLTDLSTFFEQWLTAPAAGIFSADFDASGNVDMNDFARLAGNWQAAAGVEYKGNQTAKTYSISSPLTVGLTYYWRVDMSDANKHIRIGEVWRFSCGTTHMTELIKDPYFQHGLKVYSQLIPGPSAFEGILKWNDSWQLPDWPFMQTFGRDDLTGAVAQLLPSGSYKFENASRSVVIGPVNSTDADFRTMIDTRGEIIDGNQWPSVDMNLNIASRCPQLTEMSQLRFTMDIRLLHNEYFAPQNNGICTLFKTALWVQDMNTASPGYGDFFWLVFAGYDSRIGFPTDDRYGAISWPSRNKLLYDIGTEYSTDPNINPDPSSDLFAGKWVRFSCDLLPKIYHAMQTAWEAGLLPYADPANFKITSFGPGWESSERVKCEFQLRNWSLKVVDGTSQPPEPQTATTLLHLTKGSDWGTLANWEYRPLSAMMPATALPTLMNNVYLWNSATIASDTTVQAGWVPVGYNGWPATTSVGLTINGTLTLGESTAIGVGSGANGTITVNAGATLDALSSSINPDTHNVAGPGAVTVGAGGTGVLNVFGTVISKRMDIPNWFAGAGTVNVLAGGIVHITGALTVGGSESWGGVGNLIISPGGTVICGDNFSGQLQSWINRGAIRAAPGATLVTTWHTGVDPGVTFTAHP
ncbi:MAG: hypothetical protein A2Y12_14750 [Planctomycetes bacterium GWF2_42_9]|nr:MAG: hypothetical protein A2Y12_14750 [Planctomycetes bacterium GWF2_42_9]